MAKGLCQEIVKFLSAGKFCKRRVRLNQNVCMKNKIKLDVIIRQIGNIARYLI